MRKTAYPEIWLEEEIIQVLAVEVHIEGQSVVFPLLLLLAAFPAPLRLRQGCGLWQSNTRAPCYWSK